MPTANEPNPAFSNHVTWFTPSSWHDQPVPERKWLVNRWIPAQGVSTLYGDGGTGKSLLSQQLLTCVAAGRDWLGVKTTKGACLGVFCEDDIDELHRRQAAINTHYGVSNRDLDLLELTSRIGHDNILMHFDNQGIGTRSDFWHEISEKAAKNDARLVVIDTAADVFGGNEISRSEVRQFLSGCLGHLANKIEGAVLLCAHPSLSGLRDGTGYSGSTGWNAGTRSRLNLKRVDDRHAEEKSENLRVLTREKANYANIGEPIELQWSNGVFCPPTASSRDKNKIREKGAEEAVISGFETTADQGMRVNLNKNQQNFAPKVFKKLSRENPYSITELEDAIYRLIKRKVIRNETEGPPSRQRSYLVLVNE